MFLLVFLIAGIARGRDLYVPLSFTTIQEAIEEANTGDTVWVADGTYTDPKLITTTCGIMVLIALWV